MHFCKFLAAIVLLAGVGLSAYSSASALEGGEDSAKRESDAFDASIRKQMDDAGIVGLGAAIIVDRRVVWTRGYGFADKARGVPFTPDTVMNIASISKTFTGVAVMQAVQDGKLSLDADVNDHLPFKVVNPFHPDAPITLRQLGTHTSGITDRESAYRDVYRFDGEAPEPLDRFLRSYFSPGGTRYAKDNFLDARPGTHREYSNIGAALAGYVVERVTGEPLQAYARKRIFAPLKMDRSGWSLAEIPAAHRSRLYVSQYGLPIPILPYDETTYPDGGVQTSVADLSKFFIALLNDGEYGGARILDARTTREMLRFEFTAAHKPDNVDPAEKNSGIFWQSKYNVTRMGHGGTDPGVKTEMLSDLSGDVGVIVFTNTSLADEDMKAYNALFDAIWTRAAALKPARRQDAGR